MPTDRISSSSSMIEIMRALARDKAAGTRRGEAKSTAGPSAEPTAPADTRQPAELRRRLHELARQVDTNNPQSLAEARVPALREILLWEFGGDFRKDSQFLPMVDAIDHALDIDPRLQQRFAEMMAGLQKA